MSLMNTPLLLQEFSACLVCLTWMSNEMGGKWPYSCCFVGCCNQDIFKIAYSIFVKFQSSFFFKCFVRVQVVQLYFSTNMGMFWRNACFILTERRYFHMINNQSIIVVPYWWKHLKSVLSMFLQRTILLAACLR